MSPSYCLTLITTQLQTTLKHDVLSKYQQRFDSLAQGLKTQIQAQLDIDVTSWIASLVGTNN